MTGLRDYILEADSSRVLKIDSAVARASWGKPFRRGR